jgi:hypothetical protein
MHDQKKVLEDDVARRYVGSLKSILESPGGHYWLAQMGGQEQLPDWAARLLENSTVTQDFLIYPGRGR